MIKYSPSVSYDIGNVTEIDDFVKPSSVQIISITSSFKDALLAMGEEHFILGP